MGSEVPACEIPRFLIETASQAETLVAKQQQ
jgi:hypothetical protein